MYVCLLAADDWQVSANVTPMAGGVHTCYYHKVNDSMQVGVELEGSLRTQESTTTVGYQLDLPTANLTFRGTCVTCAIDKTIGVYIRECSNHLLQK